MPYPFLAGSTVEADVAGIEGLFIGDAPIVTDSAPALANIAQWQVCVLLPTGITPYVPATHTAAAPDKIVVSQVAVTTGKQAPYYVAAALNHNMLVWPATLDTYAKRKEAVLGSMIIIGHAKPPAA